jgi:hypothetical protein
VFNRAQHLNFRLELPPLLDIGVLIQKPLLPGKIEPLDNVSDFIHGLRNRRMFRVLVYNGLDAL